MSQNNFYTIITLICIKIYKKIYNIQSSNFIKFRIENIIIIQKISFKNSKNNTILFLLDSLSLETLRLIFLIFERKQIKQIKNNNHKRDIILRASPTSSLNKLLNQKVESINKIVAPIESQRLFKTLRAFSLSSFLRVYHQLLSYILL